MKRVLFLATIFFLLSLSACSGEPRITDDMITENYSLAEVISLYDRGELIDYVRDHFSADDIWNDIDSHSSSWDYDYEPRPEDIDPDVLWDYFEEQMEQQAEMERDQREFFGY